MYPEFGDVDEIGVASGGGVHVEDHESHRIQKFTSEGVFVSKWACGLKAKGSSNTCVALGFKAHSGISYRYGGYRWRIEWVARTKQCCLKVEQECDGPGF